MLQFTSMRRITVKLLPPYSQLRQSSISSNPTPPYTSGDRKPKDPTNTSPNLASADPPRSSGAYELTSLQNRMREWSKQARLTVESHADNFAASTKTAFSQLGSQLNRVTGYEEIEALKRQVKEQEVRINATRQAARQTKNAYDHVVSQRSSSQREVNDLLQRKSNWSDNDVGRFTTLIRQDHLYEQEEARAKASVDETEDAVEREFSELMRSILARYHEEQIWSDKIRSASTYGSLVALGLNLVIFVVAIVVVEPWKRRRLAQTFEKKIEQMSIENAAMVDGGMKEIGRRLEEQARLLSDVVQTATTPTVTDPHIVHEINPPPSTSPIQKDVTQDWALGTVVAVVAGMISWQALRNWVGRS